ncbi:hypothetical protein LPJ79_000093 [Coemansia sp. RSA 1821]|nr:hypothetical protein LPJ68_000897 [Coemansia sp. RSA 1086]KAJ1753806.1 hypothetical protein LPJ79_000093 [Coemansia sp. RSA 1821]KAJ2676921.1 hypothetical protein IWW42_000259 [Coemansia sp. RSA 1085]
MKLQALLCIAMTAMGAAADVDAEMMNLNFAVAAAPNAAQGQQQQHGNNANNDKPAQADKPTHTDAKHEQPRHEAKDKLPTSTAKAKAKETHSNSKHEDAEKKNESKKPTKTHEDEDDDDEEDEDEAEKKYMERVKADKDAGKLPGRMKMIVPPRTVHTPLFELDSVVELQWEYDNNVIEVPENLMISVQLPKDPHADGGSKPVLYDIAVNITGDRKRFFWDTKNDVPDGVGMREGSGYTMYFYDGDIGFRMSDVVPAGYLIKYAMPFAFYISRYERTNDGVPRNYNPNAAARPIPKYATALLVLSIAAQLWI